MIPSSHRESGSKYEYVDVVKTHQVLTILGQFVNVKTFGYIVVHVIRLRVPQPNKDANLPKFYKIDQKAGWSYKCCKRYKLTRSEYSPGPCRIPQGSDKKDASFRKGPLRSASGITIFLR